jgi:hypothetical protein
VSGPPFDYLRYLQAKTTVDDRALNQRVWAQVGRFFASRQTNPATPCRLLEVGGGIGAMLGRLARHPNLPSPLHYHLSDQNPAFIAHLRQQLKAKALPGLRLSHIENEGETAAYHLRTLTGADIRLTLQACAVQDLLDSAGKPAPYDMVLAHAFLDLVAVERIVPGLLNLLKADGGYYFSINFDGETIFQPAYPDPAAEAAILSRYHHLMNHSRTGGRAATGRALFQPLQNAGASIEAVGSSDWVVYPQNGRYPAAEAYFVACILDTIAHDLRHQSDLPLAEWLALRRKQLAAGELIYMAHQLDFTGRRQPIK